MDKSIFGNDDCSLCVPFDIGCIIAALEKERGTYTMEQQWRYFNNVIDAAYELERYLHGE